MSCCGQKRRAWREWDTRTAKPPEPQPPTLQNPITLYYLGGSALVVTGAATNTTYLFGDRDTSLPVDERDVSAFIAMGRFATASPGG